MRTIKDSLFDGVKNQIVTLDKANERRELRKHGFIKVDDISALDYSLSFAKNKEEERFIISQEENDEIDLNDNNFERYQNHSDDEGDKK